MKLQLIRMPKRLPLFASMITIMIWSVAVASVSAKAQTSGQNEPAPDVPDAIQVPAGQQVVLYAHAKDKVIGHHSAGPTWKLNDGSEVTGKAAAHVDALDAESVPWLLVDVVSHAGKGQLNDVNTIQRVHTHGGQPPSGGCDAAHVNNETKSNYTADYYFYAPAK